MKLMTKAIVICSFILPIFVNAETLQGAFKDHFLMGTIWHGYKLGNDSRNRHVAKEKEITATEFNAITPENCMKPMFVQPKKGVFTFAESDEMVDFAEANNLVVVGHTLVWKNQTPAWFFLDDKGGQVSREVLIERLKTHIRTVVSRYRGRIDYWDVVNEAVTVDRDQGERNQTASYKSTPWLEIIGPEYIEIAYRTAHEADPSAKLLYNDYNLDTEVKLDFSLAMIADLKSRGLPIAGLGYQGHLFLKEPSLAAIERVLRKTKQANIPLHITELDVSVLPNAWKHRSASVEQRFKLAKKLNPYPDGVPEKILAEQAKRYSDVFSLFLQYSDNIERVTFWGVWDGNSWRDYRPMLGRTDYPLLIDRKFEKKPAYDAVINLVK